LTPKYLALILGLCQCFGQVLIAAFDLSKLIIQQLIGGVQLADIMLSLCKSLNQNKK
jgi:hypothetical protein